MPNNTIKVVYIWSKSAKAALGYSKENLRVYGRSILNRGHRFVWSQSSLRKVPKNSAEWGKHFLEARILYESVSFWLDADSNILSRRILLTLKNFLSLEERPKTSLGAQGPRDAEDPLIVQHTTTLKQSVLLLNLSYAEIRSQKLWTQDWDQAYVQSDEPFQSPTYLKPPRILRLPDTVLCKLLKPLYGVFNSGDYWFITIFRHFTHNLDRRSIPPDKAMFTSDDTRCLWVLWLLLADIIAWRNA